MCPPAALPVEVEEASALASAPTPAPQQKRAPPWFKLPPSSEIARLLSQRGKEQPTESLSQ